VIPGASEPFALRMMTVHTVASSVVKDVVVRIG